MILAASTLDFFWMEQAPTPSSLQLDLHSIDLLTPEKTNLSQPTICDCYTKLAPILQSDNPSICPCPR